MTRTTTSYRPRRHAILAVLTVATVALAACSAQPGAATAGPTAATTAATSAAATGPAIVPAGFALEVRQDATLGSFVAGANGRSLYIFKNDAGGASTCVDDCAANWPPLVVASAGDVTAGAGVTGSVATSKRPGGTLQVTLAGWPLYYFAADAAAADVKGQGVGGKWFLLSPAGMPIEGAAATPAASVCDSPACY